MSSTGSDQARQQAATKEVIILGASYGGLNATHYFLKHVLPALPDKQSYHVKLIDPSTTWFVRVGAPRGIVSEKLLSFDKFMLPIEDNFKQYPKETFSFVQGTATSLDASARTVTISLPDGQTQVLNYYALIIATGAASATPVLGPQGAHTVSVDAINAFRKALPEAKSIIIAGGGPAGVETAGEIGEFLNGSAGWFQSRPKTIKTQITLITADSKLLPVLRPAIAQKAEKMLNRVGVDVIYSTRVESTVPERAGRLDAHGGLDELLSKTTVTLSSGESKEVDLYIPAIGLKPNTSWLPKELLSEGGRIDTNKSTLRVDSAGPRVYAVGDAASYSKGGVFELFEAIPVVLTNVKRDLLFAASQENASGESAKVPSGKDRPLKAAVGESQVVPIGTKGGIGAIFGWKLPSFAVWLIKGRDYLASTYPDTVNGGKFKNESKWNEV